MEALFAYPRPSCCVILVLVLVPSPSSSCHAVLVPVSVILVALSCPGPGPWSSSHCCHNAIVLPTLRAAAHSSGVGGPSLPSQAHNVVVAAVLVAVIAVATIEPVVVGG